jgi:hypothetical protein
LPVKIDRPTKPDSTSDKRSVAARNKLGAAARNLFDHPRSAAYSLSSSTTLGQYPTITRAERKAEFGSTNINA